MFEDVLLTPSSSIRPRTLFSQVMSLALHVAVGIALFTLQFAANITLTPPALEHVTLLFPNLAPREPEARVPPRRNSVAPVPPAPREFHEPIPVPRPIRPELSLELPAPIVREAPKPPISVPQTPSAAPAPPLSTNNLGDAVAMAPAPVKSSPVRSAGFAGIDSSPAGTARRAPTEVGRFGVAAAVAPQPSSRGPVLPRGDRFFGADSAPAARAKRGGTTSVGGFGAVTPAATGQTPSRGGTARASGFTQASAAPAGPVGSGPVAKGSFGDTTVVAPTRDPAVAPAAVSAGTMPVEVLSKPRPEYTSEARDLKIEGEVLVELLFAASGRARVLRVLRGLGHGLDDNAIAAAQAIRFRPAKRGGVAVDSTAIVHITFQLAY